MNNAYSKNNIDSDLSTIGKALEEQYSNISLPESLRSENLIKLLPDEQSEKTLSLAGILKSKRFIPILSTAAAAVMLITVFSRISLNTNLKNKNINAESQVMVEKDSATIVTDSMIAEETAIADDETANVETGGGITSFEAGPESTMSGSDSGEDLSMYYPADSMEGLADESVSTEASEAKEIKMGGGAYGGSSEAHLMKETDKYYFYWRSVNDNDPDFKEFSAVLEIVDKQSSELFLIEGLPGIYSVFNIVVGNDSQLFVVGTSDNGVTILKYSSYRIKPLNLVSSTVVTGDVKNRYDQDNFLYIASTSSKDKISLPADAYEIKGSENLGVGIITVIDGNTGMVWEEYVLGIESKTVQRNGSKFIFQYNKEKTVNEIIATLNNGIVVFE